MLANSGMRCQHCTAENQEGLKFCNQCGSALKVSCAKCGFTNIPAAKFCGDCGSSLTPDASVGSAKRTQIAVPDPVAIDSSAPPVDSERKLVTVLFADIKGSTELEQDLDPEQARAII